MRAIIMAITLFVGAVVAGAAVATPLITTIDEICSDPLSYDGEVVQFRGICISDWGDRVSDFHGFTIGSPESDARINVYFEDPDLDPGGISPGTKVIIEGAVHAWVTPLGVVDYWVEGERAQILQYPCIGSEFHVGDAFEIRLEEVVTEPSCIYRVESYDPAHVRFISDYHEYMPDPGVSAHVFVFQALKLGFTTITFSNDHETFAKSVQIL
jgi:hypothetical protein